MTNTTTAPALDAATLLERARDLVPLLREHAREAEDIRRMTPPVEQALREGGFFRIMQPKRYGGAQATMREFLEITTELGRGDPAASWVVMIINDATYVASMCSEQVQDDMWAGGGDAAVSAVLTPTSTAQATETGYRVSGNWRSNSGAYQSQWTICAFPLPDDPNDVGFGLIPNTELEIVDTWEMAGMAGTGSHSAVAEDVDVPHHRVFRMSALATAALKPAYPHLEPEYLGSPLTAFCVPLLGPTLGAAKAALEYTIAAMSKEKPIAYSFYQRTVDAPSYRLNVGDAASRIDSAIMHAQRAADVADGFTTMTDFPPEISRAQVRRDLAASATYAREAVDLLLNAQGPGAFALANPVQRAWRDLSTAVRHPHLNVDVSREIYASALLGYEQPAPF